MLYTLPVTMDRLFAEVERELMGVGSRYKRTSYPPHNIRVVDDRHYIIEIAAAGFKKSELHVEVANDVLKVTAEKTEKEDPKNSNYVHRGLASRSFIQSFSLPTDVQVKSSSYIDGILTIYLEHLIPEEKKPRQIEVLDTEIPFLKTLAIDSKATDT
jgi:molecular chaperone IbpA